jgi:sialate O-acetylesterase
MKAGGPYTMDINGTNKITLKDILIGDVWICSGQSNMVHQMILHSVRYADEVTNANYTEIRHFWIPTMTDLQGPRDDLPTGYWKSANPKDVLDFSAIAYFLQKRFMKNIMCPLA